ncbi:type II secretion system F family protein [Streptomyces megasporus]|uniref:type II secretion system F family protein n=1 Tax=Streptomyces megasporus TaxID=44060 RepID=UPI0005683DE2|nr:type II secretion system F family protein [Streptomyces megasporus]
MLAGILCGLMTTTGVVSLAVALAGTTAPRRPGPFQRWQALRARGSAGERARRLALGAAAAAVATGVWLASGVFVAAAAAGLAVVGVPWLLAPAKSATARIARLDALSEWTQRLADILRLGKGLEQAMIDSRAWAPEAIAGPVAALSDRLRFGVPPDQALRTFADELADVTADKTVAALVLSSQFSGPGLAASLEALAASTREEVATYRRIEADRAKPRTTVRWMVAITLTVFAAGLLNPGYTAPYATPLGQLVLAVVVCAFTGVLAWMRSMAAHRPVPRFLVQDPRSVVTSASRPETAGSGGGAE